MLDLTPEEFRELGYQAIDLLAANLASLPDAPARQPMSAELRQQIMEQPLPTDGKDPAAILQAFAETVLPHPMGNASPHFFAWVNSPPAPIGVLAELLAAGMNPSVAGGDHAATYVEHAVLNWIKTLMGYPASAGA